MESKNNIKVIIFDFDGTLVDLKVDWGKVKSDIKNYFKKFEIDEDFTPLNHKIDKSLEILKIKEGSNSINTTVKSDIFKLLDIEELDALKKSAPIEHAKELLEYIHKENIHIVIVTHNGKKVVEEACKQFYFPKPKYIYSRNDEYIKPHKQLLDDIISKLNVVKNQCLIVGDAPVDEEFGTIGGINTLIKNKNYTNLLEIKEYLHA